jgi:hypothetical protein
VAGELLYGLAAAGEAGVDHVLLVQGRSRPDVGADRLPVHQPAVARLRHGGRINAYNRAATIGRNGLARTADKQPPVMKRMIHMSIPDLVIREIRARPVVAPLPRPIRTASGDARRPLLPIDVLMEAGITGRAYAFAYTPLTLRSLTQFVRAIAPELVGKSVIPRARMRQM